MKISVVVLNILLGVILLVVNFQPRTQTGQNTLGLVLGVLVIVVAIMFKRHYKWAALILPIIPFLLALYLFIGARQLEGEATLVGGPMILMALVLLVFALLEGWYVAKHWS